MDVRWSKAIKNGRRQSLGNMRTIQRNAASSDRFRESARQLWTLFVRWTLRFADPHGQRYDLTGSQVLYARLPSVGISSRPDVQFVGVCDEIVNCNDGSLGLPVDGKELIDELECELEDVMKHKSENKGDDHL